MRTALLLISLTLATAQDSVLRDFETRVDRYVQMHRALEAHTPPRVVTPDPGKILFASDALADAIVAARPNARQGDILTREIAAIFRMRINLALSHVDVDRYLAELYEGEDFRNYRARIHARDPHSRVPSGLPIALLWILPELPRELEYRIVGRDLVLWDEHAALIVDFMPNAFPEQSFTRAARGKTPRTARHGVRVTAGVTE